MNPPEKVQTSPWKSQSAGKPLLLTRIFNPEGIV